MAARVAAGVAARVVACLYIGLEASRSLHYFWHSWHSYIADAKEDLVPRQAGGKRHLKNRSAQSSVCSMM